MDKFIFAPYLNLIGIIFKNKGFQIKLAVFPILFLENISAIRGANNEKKA
jgi:hypothetical protein